MLCTTFVIDLYTYKNTSFTISIFSYTNVNLVEVIHARRFEFLMLAQM